MSILQFSPVKIGQMGVKPATYKMVSSNSLAEITTAGFLKQGTGGQFLERNDLIEVIASFGTVNVENAQLYVSIDTNGVITLNADIPEGLGQASLKAVSDNALPSVASVNGSTTIDHLASFNDITGTVEDSGIAKNTVQLSANIKANRTANIGGAGAGPLSVVVAGFTAASIVTASIQASSNPVEVQKVTATATGFDILFSGDPGATCTVNYVAFVVAQ
jgi:hypothetical protein